MIVSDWQSVCDCPLMMPITDDDRMSSSNPILLLEIVLATTVISSPIKSESEDVRTEISIVVKGEGGFSTEIPYREKPKTEEPKKSGKAPKPIFYGKKFELPHKSQYEVKENIQNEGNLYSPIIMSPIRTYSSKESSQETKSEALKQNQNEIFSSIQDFLSQTSESSLNKTYFSEEVSESENQGGESTTTGNPKNYSNEESQESVSRSRQDGDRSLMVVLPFKANEENIQELFTKSPMVKLIETSDDLTTETTKAEGTTSTPVVIERKIIPTTKKSQKPESTRKRWRPYKEYRTTTEPYFTTENAEDLTKTYTNYNDVEMITKKYENPTFDTIDFDNHKEELDVATPHTIQKQLNRLENSEIEESTKLEAITTTSSSTSSTIEGLLFDRITTKSKSKRKGQRRKPTTEGPPKPEDLSKILEILPPDMKDLLLQIGLNKNEKGQQENDDRFQLERLSRPSIDPMSYSVFKPLPLEEKNENRNFVPDDMKEFLASFGLLPLGKRVQKSLKAEPTKKPLEKITELELDFLPNDLKAVLEDMGLVKYSNKREPTRIHIFNPSNHTIAQSDEDLEKLNAILTSIKTAVNESQTVPSEMHTELINKIRDLDSLRYKNGNLSDINNEIKRIVVNNKTTTEYRPRTTKRATKLIDGPDPLMFSEESPLKNDVKRQDTSASSASSSSSSSDGGSSSSASSSASSTSEETESSASSSASSTTGEAESSASSSSSSTTGEAESSASSSSSTSGGGTTTEEAPNIEALKESFGGGETASDDEDVESNLPPKRPNGLYLLLDWNSFLEVGTDDDNRRVNLRFQPKIGDSRNFLPVTVP